MTKGIAIPVREHGTSGPFVVAVHGGPGAVGDMAPVARELAGSFRVLEPWQRGGGGEPLSVALHVADLHGLVESRCGGARPAIVGHSWGAMLALAYAAAHPDQSGPIVLVGCGTFDPDSRSRLRAVLEERTNDGLRRRLKRLAAEFPDPAERMRSMHTLTRRLYLYDPIPADEDDDAPEPFDIRAHTETWEDMVRLQDQGVYPAAFAAIRTPVLMLHGAFDPHPGRMIRATLKPHLPQLEYREWERCGHSPWLEKAVRGEFFAVVRGWLARHLVDRTNAAPPGGSPA